MFTPILQNGNCILAKNLRSHLDVISEKIINITIDGNSKNISILTGVTSRTIFLDSLARFIPERKEEFKNIIHRDISFILKYIEKNEVLPYNINGLSGFGWGVSYLCQTGMLNENENELLSDLDDYLFQQAQFELKNSNYDFFYGGLGYGNYFFKRIKSNPDISSYLQQIVLELKSSSIRKGKFTIWQTSKDIKEGTIDFSISHGLSSIIVFLSNLIKNKIELNYCYETIHQCCEYIIKYKTITNEGFRFPDYVCKENINFSPLRWCHGELGIITALAIAGNQLNNSKIINSALEGALTISNFKMDKKQELYSANICHGTIGVAHVFLRLYNYFGKKRELENAALYWLQKSDKMMHSKTKYTYFDDDSVFREKQGILHGLEGMGLGILAALDSTEPAWDSSILLS